MKRYIERRLLACATFLSMLVLIAALLSAISVYAYECVDKAQAQRDYDTAKQKLLSIQKERTIVAQRDRIQGALMSREIKAFFQVANVNRAYLDLAKTHDDEEDAAFKKWYWQKHPSDSPGLLPSHRPDGGGCHCPGGSPGKPNGDG